MSRTALPFVAGDLSALARALKRELEAAPDKPGHLQLLNMLSRAVGYRNYQHFRADAAAKARLQPPIAADAMDHGRVRKAASAFDEVGRLVRWPSRLSQQRLCLWVLWSRFPAGAKMTEGQVNDVLNAWHLFGDHALLRRELINNKLLARTPDCREYRRVEQRPSPEALALIEGLSGRS